MPFGKRKPEPPCDPDLQNADDDILRVPGLIHGIVLFPVNIRARTTLVPIDTCTFLDRDTPVRSRDAFVLFEAPLLFAQLARLGS
jgi:hypothetical protein